MKLCFISDTHMQLGQIIHLIPECDYLIHCGDMTNFGTIPELMKVNEQFGQLLHKVKECIICIAGNHDIQLEKDLNLGNQIFTNAVYLNNEGLLLSNMMYLYGSPITPKFMNWAFMKTRGEEINRYWNQIPEWVDILVTHGPSFGVLDVNMQGMNCGCEMLKERLKQLKKLKIHAHGHLHEAYAIERVGNITVINCASVNIFHDPINKPILIEI